MKFNFHASVVALAVAGTVFAQPAQAQGFLGSLFTSSKSTGAQDSPAKVLEEARNYSSKHEDWAQAFMHALYRDGEWGAVLNFQRLGLAAIEKQRFALARKAFDEAIARVEAIYADDANAAKARSVFNEEKVKDFKGEPYERAMLYFYRGLLYLHDGDYQNARASFLAADRHVSLSSAEVASYASDFGLMKYLAGWASSCDGDSSRAEQLIGEAQQSDAVTRALPTKPANSIILVDTGLGPVKWGDGKYNEVLKFKPSVAQEAAFTVTTAGGAAIAGLQLAGDVTYQAKTRGGREVDGIMQGKAQFKDTAGTVGNTALAIGQQTAMLGAISGDRSTANAGMAGMLFGLIAKGVEAATTPAADIRAWDSLPAAVKIHSAPDVAKAPFQIAMAGVSKTSPLHAARGQCSFAWARTHSAQTVAMGGTAAMADGPPVESNRGERNRALRAMLINELADTK